MDIKVNGWMRSCLERASNGGIKKHNSDHPKIQKYGVFNKWVFLKDQMPDVE
jgi:hypothetical protein